MAMRANEAASHRRDKSSSAPSSPRSRITYSTASHGRRTSGDTTDRELPLLPRKPMPNYLKPTISSANNICPCADKKPSPPLSAARRLLLRKRSVDAASTQRSPRVINSIRDQHKTPTAMIAPLPNPPRPLSLRALKTPKTDKAPPSLKSRTLRKRRDGEAAAPSTRPKEEEEEEEHSPMDKHPVAFATSPSHRGDLSDDQYEGSGESMAGEEVDGGKQRIRRWQPAVVRVEDDGGELMRRLKFRQEREEEEIRDDAARQERKESPKSNEVIEETASTLAGKRRSKVAALVGAFETVMSLHEGEPSHTEQQQEEEEEVQGVEGRDAAVEAADAGEKEEVVVKVDENSGDGMAMEEKDVMMEGAEDSRELAEDVKTTAEFLGETTDKGYEASIDEGAREESVVGAESDACLTDHSNTRL